VPTFFLCFLRGAGDVRRSNDVGQSRLAVNFFGGSSTKDVKGGTAEASALKGLGQVGFVDEFARAALTIRAPFFHFCNRGGVNHVRVAGLRAVCREMKSLSA